MLEEEAIKLATQHLAKNPFPMAGFRWRLGPGTRVPEGWYFDYAFESLDGAGELPAVGGAPGFLVFNDGRVESVPWAYWHKLHRHGA